jgi:hypothetical protein
MADFYGPVVEYTILQKAAFLKIKLHDTNENG